jgi:hypothetical protein
MSSGLLSGFSYCGNASVRDRCPTTVAPAGRWVSWGQGRAAGPTRVPVPGERRAGSGGVQIPVIVAAPVSVAVGPADVHEPLVSSAQPAQDAAGAPRAIGVQGMRPGVSGWAGPASRIGSDGQQRHGIRAHPSSITNMYSIPPGLGQRAEHPASDRSQAASLRLEPVDRLRCSWVGSLRRHGQAPTTRQSSPACSARLPGVKSGVRL